MRKKSVLAVLVMVMAGIFALASFALAEKRFSESVGPVQVGPVKSGPWNKPFIFWGADMVDFWGNGLSLTTRTDSIYGKLGLNIKLVSGDDPVKQARDYLTGQSAFFRGTVTQAGIASEVLNAELRTVGRDILLYSLSQGDHCVVKGDRIKTFTKEEFRGKTFAMQEGGLHDGFMQDILNTLQLTWDDVKIVRVKEITGKGDTPGNALRNRPDIDGAFVVTPDMIGLTGGSETVGTGAEGTLKGAKVIQSTAQMSRSIMDKLYVRSDFYEANRENVTKYVAGYFKAAEEVVEQMKLYKDKGFKGAPKYRELLAFAQSVWGKEVLPTLEDDAHGLLSDAILSGYPGNVTYFEDKNNLNGFEATHKAALNLAVNRGYIKNKTNFLPSDIDYRSKVFVGYLKQTGAVAEKRFRSEALEKEIFALSSGEMDERKLYSFNVGFEANQIDFDIKKYDANFKHITEVVFPKFGKAGFVIRGHADPTLTLLYVIKAGLAKGIIKQTGTTGNYQYYYKGKLLDLNNTGMIEKIVESGEFDGVTDYNPRQVMAEASKISGERGQNFKKALLSYAKVKGIKIDESQIVVQAVGIREPIIAKPRNATEAANNMRVEVAVMRVSGEAMTQSDFDF